MATVLGDLAQLVVQRLDAVGRVDDAPEHRREVQEQDEPLPGRHRLGVLDPMSDSEKSVRACQAASWLGAVQIGLESGRDLPAVPVGDEPHRGTDQVDHTGLDRGLGPGRLDRLGKAGEPVAAHDQHVLDASVGQLSAHMCPEGGSFLGLDPDT